jgi:hypothetical protein
LDDVDGARSWDSSLLDFNEPHCAESFLNEVLDACDKSQNKSGSFLGSSGFLANIDEGMSLSPLHKFADVECGLDQLGHCPDDAEGLFLGAFEHRTQQAYQSVNFAKDSKASSKEDSQTPAVLHFSDQVINAINKFCD